MKRSKQHQMLKDLVKSTKAIRLNNFIPVSEVDMFIGQDGICKSIESASWQFEPNHTRWDEPINLYQFMSYLSFIDCALMSYNNAPEEEQKENAKKRVEKDMGIFDDLFKGLLGNYGSKPKFI